MRILHTADWHLGRTLEGRSRLEEQAAFMDELAQIAIEEQVDLVLIAGDVYDTVNPPAAAEQLFYESIVRISDGGRRPVLAIAGNHDNPDRLSAAAPLAGKQGIVLLGLPTDQVQQVGVSRTGETARVFALPYPSEARLQEVLAEHADEELLRSAYSQRVARLMAAAAEQFRGDSVNVIMSHLYALGGKECESERPIQVGGAYTVDAGAFHIPVQYTALGHLHRPQMIKAATPVRYCGSPMAYSFSEAGQAKSVTIVDVKPGAAAEWREIPLNCGRPLVRWEATGGLAQVEQWLAEGRDTRAWIDLELHVTDALSMEQIQRLRKAHAGLIHIRPVFPDAARQSAAGEAVRGLSMEERFKQFYTKQTGGAEPESELVRLFLELLDEKEADAQDGGDAA